MQRVPPVEIELEFGGQPRLFKLAGKHVAELQEACGRRVQWPDGATGTRPKPLGTIWREHRTGEYDLKDSHEVLRIGLIGGGMPPLDARHEEQRVTAEWPADMIWDHAVSVLMGACQGFQPPGEPDAAAPTQKKTRTKKTSSSTSQPPQET